jgi:hypothetical protein
MEAGRVAQAFIPRVLSRDTFYHANRETITFEHMELQLGINYPLMLGHFWTLVLQRACKRERIMHYSSPYFCATVGTM